MEQKNIISNENERKQRPCPVCLEMIDETAETCPYCDEPTYFKHAHTNDTAAARAIDNEPAKEGMSLWKKVLIGFGCILAALFVIGLFLPDDESKDVAAADTEQLLDEYSSSSDNNEEPVYHSPEESAETTSMPYGVLSVPDALGLVEKYGLDILEQEDEMEKYEYVGRSLENGEMCWCKNCMPVITDESPLPSPASVEDNSSFVYIDYGQLRVVAYDKDVFSSWLKQLKALGYNETSKSEDDLEASYTYEKSEKPTIWVYISGREYHLWVSLAD